MKVVDLFSGVGGLSLGFANAGHEIIASYDNWKAAIAVHRANFKHPIIDFDLTDPAHAAEEIRRHGPEMIIGGAPCQPYSHSGKRDADNDPRSNLTLAFAKIVTSIKPQYFVMENVDRFAKSKQYEQTRFLFEEAGYGVYTQVLDAALCGAPQHRKRCFMVGMLGRREISLEAVYKKHLAEKPLTVREYLGDKIDTEYYYRHPRTYDRRAIFSIDEPSPTIRGCNRPIPKNYACHPRDACQDLTKVRPLATIERSRIQTFPEGFSFEGVSKSDADQVIGNAVPVNQAEFVAKCLGEFLCCQ